MQTDKTLELLQIRMFRSDWTRIVMCADTDVPSHPARGFRPTSRNWLTTWAPEIGINIDRRNRWVDLYASGTGGMTQEQYPAFFHESGKG